MASGNSVSEGSASARGLAREILAEGRFHKATVPRPLHSALREIGRALESPLNGLNELVDKLGTLTPGGSPVIWGTLALVVLLASAAIAHRGTRHALREPPGSAQGNMARLAPPSASDLERQAVAAERLGRYGDAVRLRFRAGLLRLADSHIVGEAPSMVNAEIVRVLGSPSFGVLAARFDEIAYGGSAASQEDVQLSRREWTHVLEGARAR
jgi:hypothetical protein